MVKTTDFAFSVGPLFQDAFAGTSASVNIAPVPLGVNGSNTNHWLRIVDSTAGDEIVLITGGSALSGAPSGTLEFTPSLDHVSGNWTLATASAGVQEAAWYVGDEGCLEVPPGMHPVYSAVTLLRNQAIVGCGRNSSTLERRFVGDTHMVTCPAGVGTNGYRVAHLGFRMQPELVPGEASYFLHIADGHHSVGEDLYFERGQNHLLIEGVGRGSFHALMHLDHLRKAIVILHSGIVLQDFTTSTSYKSTGWPMDPIDAQAIEIQDGAVALSDANIQFVFVGRQNTHNTEGISLRAAAGVEVHESTFANFLIDGPKYGIRQVGEGNTRAHVFSNFRIAAIVSAITLDSQCNEIQFQCGQFSGNRVGLGAEQDVIILHGCKDIVFDQCHIADLRADDGGGPGQLNGIRLASGGAKTCRGITVKNCVIGIRRDDGAPDTLMRHSLYIADGNDRDLVISDNRLYGTVSPIRLPTTAFSGGLVISANSSDSANTVADCTATTFLDLPKPGVEIVRVNGTTAIQSITGGFAGRKTQLLMKDGAPFASGGNIGVPRPTAPGELVTAIYDGNLWFIT